MTTTFENLNAGDASTGRTFAVSRESIRLFCDASLDYNPLHLDDDYMKGNFGKTNFGGIIMHGMNNFGLISRMLTDWAYPAGAIHRRLETRWVKPVRPGDTIQPAGIVKSKQVTQKFALGADRRHGAQPDRREGRHRRGHGRVPGWTESASYFGIGSCKGSPADAWNPAAVTGKPNRRSRSAD